jgi:hypothetical protein
MAARLLSRMRPTERLDERDHAARGDDKPMTNRRELDESFLAEITRRLAEISETQHDLARQQRILSHAATQLRTGKRAESVLAEIREQNPEMLRDYCDLQVTLTPPLRPVPRAVASA